jgi:hypothetical protein
MIDERLSMTSVTLRVLDGADRGKVHAGLRTPITIGREEGNTIQLNDERVSRFHAKIQCDQDKLILTDLESTNGTKVNGEETQIRILRFGDVVSIGKTSLLYGSREEIAERLARISPDDVPSQLGSYLKAAKGGDSSPAAVRAEVQAALQALHPPPLPERLSPAQSAQVAEVLEYFHIRMRRLAKSASGLPGSEKIQLDARQWQELLDVQSRLAEYLRGIADPDPRP